MLNIILPFQKRENNETHVNQYISERGPDDVTLMGGIGRHTHPYLDPTGRELPIDTTSVDGDVGTDFIVWAELHNSINCAIVLSKELDDKYEFSAKTEKYQPIYTILQKENIRLMFDYAFAMKIIQNGQNKESNSVCTYEMIKDIFFAD